MHKYHTWGKQHFLHQTGPEQRSHYENYTGLIAITLRVFFGLSQIRKYDNMKVFHKYDVVVYNVRFQKIAPNHFDQTTLVCIVWWHQMWYMWLYMRYILWWYILYALWAQAQIMGLGS